jgi:CRP-like cAMP-binding protein
MAKGRVVSTKEVSPPSRKDGDGKEIGNHILLEIPPQESAKLFPSLEFVRLNLRHVMHEAGAVMKSAYFLNNGLGSVLTVLPDGKSVEVGLIGKEGFVGTPIVFGYKSSPLRVVVQADATGYRVDVPTLRKILSECPKLERLIQRFAMTLQSPARCRGTISPMAADEPRPDWRRDHAPDAGISGTDARNPKVERQRSCRHFAKGGDDHLHARQCHNPGQTPTRRRGLRLLSGNRRSKKQVAGGDPLDEPAMQAGTDRLDDGHQFWQNPRSICALVSFLSLRASVVKSAFPIPNFRHLLVTTQSVESLDIPSIMNILRRSGRDTR